MSEQPEPKTDEAEPQSLTDVIDELEDKAEEDGDLSVDEAVEEFAGRLFGPLLVVPGLLVTIPPIGAIPFLPTSMGLLIILVASQRLFGRQHPWLPGILAERSVSEEKFTESIDRARPWLAWVDKFTSQRMEWMIAGPMKRALAFICILVALTMPPLEFLPMACIVPGAAIVLIGLGITARDGLFALVGAVGSLAAFYFVTQAWSAAMEWLEKLNG